MTDTARTPTASTITDDELDHLRQRLDDFQTCALDREAILEEIRDALEAAGHPGAHGDDWPRIAPAVHALIAERDEARARLAAYENAPALRFCLVPGCLRQFDVIASMTGATPTRPEWDGAGWRTLGCGSVIPAGGHICPEHAELVAAHLPGRSEPSYPGRVGVACACGGWLTEWHRWHGAARGLWEQHLLEAGGLLPDAEPLRHTGGEPGYCPACRATPGGPAFPQCPGPNTEGSSAP